ncbi:MAG: hypothetical protein K1X35_13000 [Caulobacteraceae bacterium]|nr:hypothetical protein [Caulobacteraceae bacterium]
MSGPGALRRFFGGLLMVAGGLIAGLAGVCTLVFGGGSAMDLANGHGYGLGGDLGGLLALVGIFGGVPIAVGLLLFFLGRWVRRQG